MGASGVCVGGTGVLIERGGVRFFIIIIVMRKRCWCWGSGVCIEGCVSCIILVLCVCMFCVVCCVNNNNNTPL